MGRPLSHGREVTGTGRSVLGRGSFVGGSGGGNRNSSGRGGGGGRSPFSLLIVVVFVIISIVTGNKSNILSSILGGLSSSTNSTNSTSTGTTPMISIPTLPSSIGSTAASSISGVGSAWSGVTDNRGQLDTSVHESAREKFYRPTGGDSVTVMVYMCGTDLETKHGMATKDLIEMTKANISSNVNLLVYTGGTNTWQNSVVSSSNNEIYQIADGKMNKLADDNSNPSMTDPNTLVRFIDYCKNNFPANRYQLIFWDHGGGSVTGYGYDEKNPNSGSMNLAKIKAAIAQTGIKYDFIGFDACLMATTETALALSEYADYLIASEETEPGTGWYYTNWLSNLSSNTAISTLDLGKKIVDDFIDESNRSARGQSTTLSLVDLAELKATVPSSLSSFARDTASYIENNEYSKVSYARTASREFAKSSNIDQVDLVNLVYNLEQNENDPTIQSILGAVKYNRTSSNMSNSYGLSIYFPYKKLSKVDRMVQTYGDIGMDSEYTKMIQQFATLQASGQIAGGGETTPANTLTGNYQGNSSGSFSAADIDSLIASLISGSLSSESLANIGLDTSSIGFLQNRNMSDETIRNYVLSNRLDASKLQWTDQYSTPKIHLSEDEWNMVSSIEENMLLDMGSGYIDMGLDNFFEFDENGDMLADTQRAWIAIDQQYVAYYHLSTTKNGDETVTIGRVPVILNGERANLIIIFDGEHPNGYLAGANTDYKDTQTETIAKNITDIVEGDRIQFIYAYYGYDGTYLDDYKLDDEYVVGKTAPKVSYVLVKDDNQITYKFTDIYNNSYWTPALKSK
ncbi:MAG: clostripain-related cysteine peptidase [Lachnoanaerobaculum sp.]|nr:clostripain-related cysteine peptidase [Lachnoanaerobaculum sp.]